MPAWKESWKLHTALFRAKSAPPADRAPHASDVAMYQALTVARKETAQIVAARRAAAAGS